MTRISPWIVPTLLGPVLGAGVYVFVLSRGSSVPTAAWVLAMVVASVLAMVVGGTMLATDFALLKLKLRELPKGWRAWAMGALAPIPVFWCWQQLVRFAITGLVPLLISFFLPMLLIALVLRIALGTRPKSWS